MLYSYFEVEYIGNLNAVCRYGTQSELNNAGFTIRRGRLNFEYDDIAEYEALSDDIFTTTVASYKMPQYAKRMAGQLVSYTNREYEPIPDVIEYR